MKQQVRFTTVLLGIVVVLAFVSMRLGQKREYLNFAVSLGETVATVDGNELCLSDMAFYIAYEEKQVEQDALVYNPEDTGEYWKIYSNGTFIRTAAKQTAIDMAVHDEIFYQMALAERVVLDEEEQKSLSNTQYDFWNDLEEAQKDSLGVSEDTLDQSMNKIALGQKYQKLYASMHQTAYEEYDFNGDAYQKLLKEHPVSVKEDIWDRVHFGSITVEH